MVQKNYYSHILKANLELEEDLFLNNYYHNIEKTLLAGENGFELDLNIIAITSRLESLIDKNPTFNLFLKLNDIYFLRYNLSDDEGYKQCIKEKIDDNFNKFRELNKTMPKSYLNETENLINGFYEKLD